MISMSTVCFTVTPGALLDNREAREMREEGEFWKWSVGTW